jgi:argininosuccinate synthase
MNTVVVLADDGRFDAAALALLGRRCAADVVTMTVEVGQSRDVRAIRDAALAAGAARVHLFDAVDDFVRICVLPALQSTRHGAAVHTAALVYPVIAARLVDVAHQEGTRQVAHGGGEALTRAILDADSSLQVRTIEAVSRWSRDASAPARHLLQRPVIDPAVARGVAANVEIEFEAAIPVAINGVPLTLPELIESLSLIGGQHGIGYAESADAPGVLVLETAYRALEQQSGVVRLELLDGHQRVLSAESRLSVLVNQA